MENLKEIFTNRLILRCITPSDIHVLFSSSSKEEIMAFFGTDEKGFEKYRAMHEKGMETDRLSLVFFLLVELETGIPIGECGFHTWNKFHHRAELFYHLVDDKHKQKGYMSEALPEVLRFGFESMLLNRIQAMVANDNTPSVKLLQKHGFVWEGTCRQDYLVESVFEDSECYSLLKHEWAQNRI